MEPETRANGERPVVARTCAGVRLRNAAPTCNLEAGLLQLTDEAPQSTSMLVWYFYNTGNLTKQI